MSDQARKSLTSEESEKLETAKALTLEAHELWDQGRFAYAYTLRNVANLRYVQQKYSEADEREPAVPA